MAKNNVKILTDVQLCAINDKYCITLENDKLAVRTKNYGKCTLHSKDEPFSINMKWMRRKVTFSIESINLWIELHEKFNCTLFDVQNIVNSLIVMYLQPTKENVINILQKGTTKIKKV